MSNHDAPPLGGLREADDWNGEEEGLLPKEALGKRRPPGEEAKEAMPMWVLPAEKSHDVPPDKRFSQLAKLDLCISLFVAFIEHQLFGIVCPSFY